MVAAIKLFGENSIGISQSAVKAYLGMKIDVRLRKVDYIDDLTNEVIPTGYGKENSNK